MSYHETDNWKNIAHDEYENRRGLEAQLTKTTNALSTLKQSLAANTNYNKMLEQRLAELEAQCSDHEAKYQIQASKLTQSIELLKKAKLLLAQRKQEFATLEHENKQLNYALIKKSTLLEAEMLEHEKTNHKLAHSLSKLAAATTAAIHATQQLAAPNIIYAEAAPAEAEALIEEGVVGKMFAYYDPEAYDEVVDLGTDQEFMDQILYFQQQYNK